MPRPRKCRNIGALPNTIYFKPKGVPMRRLREVILPLEGYEALRLADLQGLKQGEAAELMRVSRQTFGRILAEARRLVTEALVKGLALRIQVGSRQAGGMDHISIAGCSSTGSTEHAATAAKERPMGKIAISCEGPSLDDQVDPRFGRAAGFLIVDTDSMQTVYVDNGGSQVLAQGAGIQAAEAVASAGAGVVLTGYVGPKAFMALSAAGIQVGQNLENMTAREALERYLNGQIPMASQPNRGGHRK